MGSNQLVDFMQEEAGLLLKMLKFGAEELETLRQKKYAAVHFAKVLYTLHYASQITLTKVVLDLKSNIGNQGDGTMESR